jgi:hypothetical protein
MKKCTTKFCLQGRTLLTESYQSKSFSRSCLISSWLNEWDSHRDSATAPFAAISATGRLRLRLFSLRIVMSLRRLLFAGAIRSIRTRRRILASGTQANDVSEGVEEAEFTDISETILEENAKDTPEEPQTIFSSNPVADVRLKKIWSFSTQNREIIPKLNRFEDLSQAAGVTLHRSEDPAPHFMPGDVLPLHTVVQVLLNMFAGLVPPFDY